MLTAYQSNELTRFRQIQNFTKESLSIYSSYAPFANEMDSFNANLRLLEGYAVEKQKTTENFTTSKKNLKKQTAFLFGNICSTVQAYALTCSDPQLTAAVDYTSSTITRAKDVNVLPFVTKLVATVTPLLSRPAFAEYKLDKQVLDEVTGCATRFHASISKASVAVSFVRVAGKNISEVVKLLQQNIKQLKRLIGHFTESNPYFVEGFSINAKTKHRGIRHSGIEGTITAKATGEAITNAVITIESKNKSVDATIKGEYRLIHVHPGRCKVQVSAPGYETAEQVITITRGKIILLDVALLALDEKV